MAGFGTKRAIGLMSGTSADGIDAALITTDGEKRVETGPWKTTPYQPGLRDMLRALDPDDATSVGMAEAAMTQAHVTAVKELCDLADITTTAVDVIGFHGHTVRHDPEQHSTQQIGDGARLAHETGIDVVCDFRSADMAAGGQGAPLAPYYHFALATELHGPLAILNIGGVANVTWLDRDNHAAMLAFDTGPGNALLDDWTAQHTQDNFDRDGQLAATGTADPTAVASMMRDRYFAAPPPKSLDRDHFSVAADSALRGMSPADGAATLVEFTATSAALAERYFPEPVRAWLVCGGGRHNPVLMAALEAHVDVPVAPVEAVHWQGDALEAQAFGYLAVRSLRGLPLTLPRTTGVPKATTGGVLFHADAVA